MVSSETWKYIILVWLYLEWQVNVRANGVELISTKQERQEIIWAQKICFRSPKWVIFLIQVTTPCCKKRILFNRVYLEKDLVSSCHGGIVVPPPLHVKLGFINKILDSFDSIVTFMNRKNDIHDNEVSDFNDH